MKHGSLFSGIGGFDLAAEWMGWTNIFHCERAEFPRQILKKNFPNAITYEDITKTDFKTHRGEIDIISGGFPCQPFSVAGERKGTEDDRYLWKEMLRAICEIQPSFVVAENVRGLTNWNKGMVFDQVQADLEIEGFEILPILLPACAVNAPHRRDRIWFVAYNQGFQNSALSNNKSDWQHSKSKREFRGNNFCVDWRKTASEICGNDDGLPNRVDRLTALGNAIVPQVAYEIFKCIGLLAVAPLTLKTNGA